MGPKGRADALELSTGGRTNPLVKLRQLLDRIGGWFPRNTRSEAVTTRIWLKASPEAVWRVLRFYEDIPKRPGPVLLALLPRPLRSEGEKTRVGATVRCQYDGGHLVKRITVSERGRLLRFDVLEQQLGIERLVSMGEGAYALRPEGQGTEVLLTTHYRGHLRPRALFRPFERLLAHRVHRHILRGMKTLLWKSEHPNALAVAEPHRLVRVAHTSEDAGPPAA